MSAGSSLAKSLLPTQFTAPEICRGKMGRTVVRMLMRQDRQGNILFTIVRRKNMRKIFF